MSNSPLATYEKISPNKTSPRKHKIDTITIHCYVGQVTAKQGCDFFASTSRAVSSNYVIGYDGSIGLSVEEKDRSWCTGGKDPKTGKVIKVNGISGADNDHRAITIEVASESNEPYAITDKAYKALVELCADICRRNNIKGLKWKGNKTLVGKPDEQNMTVHRWFAVKSCPGDYIYSRLDDIAKEVNAKLDETTTKKPNKTTNKTTVKAEPETIYYVQTGAFRNKTYAEEEFHKVKKAGFNPYLVKVGSLYKIQVGAYKKKPNAEAMAKRLILEGFKSTVTTLTGDKVGVAVKKSIKQIAEEVIAGKWGNGTDRKTRLTKAGYDYDAVQKKVNELV